MSPRPGVDRCGKSRTHRDSIPGPSSPYPVGIPAALPGPLCFKLNTAVIYLSQRCPTRGLPGCVMRPAVTFVNYVYMEFTYSKVI